MKPSLLMATLLPFVIAGCAEPASDTSPQGSATVSPAQACASPYSTTKGNGDIGNPPIDFRGTWVLNTDRGANLGMMKAVKETIVATQTADQAIFAMTDVFAGMTTTRTVTYDLNGGTAPNKAAMGAESETSSQWAGNTLVTTWAAEGAIAGTTSERTETRCLSDNGKTLNITMTKAGNPDIEEAIWFVYEKSE
ncbi:MAG: hypothetical protein HKN56_08510 [Gammaproteobacteria bacterium]|nr:hypothetical protein [Gammaproteobacteria bacterium]